MGMEGERNAPLSGEAPARSPPESESPASSVLGDFIPGPTMEETGEDVSLEWLSIYVEHCLSSSTTFSNPHPLPTPPSSSSSSNNSNSSSSSSSSKNNNSNSQTPQFCQEPKPQHLQNPIPVPAKSRTKRRRITTTPRSLLAPPGGAHYGYDYGYGYGPLLLAPPDPPLLHQTHWLADSELLSFPKTSPQKEEDRSSSESKNPSPNLAAAKGAEDDDDDDGDDGGDEEEEEEEEEEKGKEGGQQQGGGQALGQGQGQGQQLRRCTHCLSHKTPQWRAGPLGPKTLCNACGVRFKSGRLLPEYRPAKSPTFVSYKHSNSHKKVMEMRMMAILSSQSN